MFFPTFPSFVAKICRYWYFIEISIEIFNFWTVNIFSILDIFILQSNYHTLPRIMTWTWRFRHINVRLIGPTMGILLMLMCAGFILNPNDSMLCGLAIASYYLGWFVEQSCQAIKQAKFDINKYFALSPLLIMASLPYAKQCVMFCYNSINTLLTKTRDTVFEEEIWLHG